MTYFLGNRLILRCRRLAMLMITVLVLAATPADGQTRRKTRTSQRTTRQTSTPKRTVESVRKDRNSTEKKISETTTRLNTTSKELKRQINKLNSLNADIEVSRIKVAELRNRVDSLGSAINASADSLRLLEEDLEKMRLAYFNAMRQMQPHAGSLNELGFILSSKSFLEASRRVRYLRQFSAWRERRAENIRQSIDRIAERRLHLTSLRHSHDQAYRKAEEAQASLSKQQEESSRMVTNLKKEDSALRSDLKEQKRKAAALDRELDRLIAAEQARIAREEAARAKKEAQARKKTGSDKHGGSADADGRSAKEVASAKAGTRTAASTAASALSGSFEANKGRLLFPVTGSYKIVRRFGRQPHPTLKHVETENSGIDIEVRPGSTARAVFAGKVSAIFKQDGFNSIVMIRHGRYITIYANLSGVSVKQGDNVKAGQAIGNIHSDPDDGNRTILHFEIRNERRKLNPSLWVK